MPAIEFRGKYCRERQRQPSACARGSFRTIKSGKARIVICCPKGKWNKKTQRCRVGTTAQSVLRPRTSRFCKLAARKR